MLTAITVLVLDLPGTGPLDPVRGGLAAVFRPIRAVGNTIFEPFSNGWKGAFNYGDVKDRNDDLKRQLEERKSQESTIARLEQEVADLEELNEITVEAVATKPAEVISNGLSSFDQAVEINVGSNDGIKNGMAVVSAGGVLGRITKVRSNSSTVRLITESSFSIGVRLSNGDIGLAKGQGQGNPLRVDRIEDESDVKEGDFAYTSGVDRSAFPKDLNVGRVSKVNKSEGGIPRTIELEPTADLSARYVRVILREAP